MSHLPGRLGTLTARDVMTPKVIVVYEQDSLEVAISTLRDNHITGAPVVNDKNHLVGILSIHDLLPGDDADDLPARPLAHGADHVTWDLYDRAELTSHNPATDKVLSRMSQPVTSVTPDAPLVEVARVMCDGHWHRVPVADAAGELVGMISTLDVIAALVNVEDEPE